MSKQIWVRKGQEVRGPFSAAEIRQLADDGKLTPLHEISSDQSRWKLAGEVPGLGFAGRQSDGEQNPALAVSEIATSAGGRFALGVMLLVVLALVVIGGSVLKFGFIGGGVVAAMFLLSAGLGYPAASLGRDVSAVYVLVMAVVCVLLLGESPVRFGTTLASWAAFAVGLVPGFLIVAGWTLIAHGLGHDNQIAEMARLNPSRFASLPISGKEQRRALAAMGASAGLAETPDNVELRLDPDDLDRVEDTFGEVVEQEAKRSAPGLMVSFVFHALLLLGFAVWQLRSVSPGELTIELGWTTISPDEEVVIVLPENRELELEAVKLHQQDIKPVEKPLQPLNPGPRNAVPVKPAEVGGLFEGRDEENRRRILKEELENGERIEQAISQGLSWLQRQQQSAGNWQLHTGYPDASDWPQLRTDSGATALALLCYLGNGQTHKNAKDKATQEIVQKGLNWLIGVQNQNGNGDFHDLSSEQGRQPAFYAHSQATIAVCEAYAMTGDRALYEPAQKGVEYLLNSQQPNEGGWKYQPLDARSIGDLSVTGWALMALHSARAAGISVPEEPFQRASKFLDSVQEEDGARYKYQPEGWQVTRSMTAEGLLCRQFLGWPRNHPQLVAGVEFLLDEKHRPEWSDGRRDVYEWYYVGHVLHNLNDEEWTDWYGVVQKELIDSQTKVGTAGYRGSWHPNKPQGAPYEHADKAGRLYITAMCLLILEMPIRHQPIYRD